MRDIVRILRCICWIGLIPAAWSQTSLADFSLEDLLKVQVTSVSKKEQTLARTAASVYVIHAEEIRRTGAENLPDLLRAVPGVNVAQIDAGAWAISIRGMNGRYSSKVLVMVDGRAVYTSTFGGVYWDQIDLPLESVERVEVIRGPGGTIWGANAVNGVIHVITKNASATLGGLVSQSAGSDGAVRSLVQYGDKAGRHGSYRAYGNFQRFPSMEAAAGEAADQWQRYHAGFRGDWQTTPRDTVMVEGGLFVDRGNQNRRTFVLDLLGSSYFSEPVRANGGDAMARWTHISASGAETKVQAYVDSYHRRDLGLSEQVNTMDLDVQRSFSAGDQHEIMLAGGFRAVSSILNSNSAVSFTPAHRLDQLYSVFAQDQIRLADKVWLTAGSKLEHNSYTGFEYEPSLRLAWTPGPSQTVWAAVARAIRQPARADAGVHLNVSNPPVSANTEQVITFNGSPGIRSEQLRDAEAGYRRQWGNSLSLDIAAFFSRYHGLLTQDNRPAVIQGWGDTLHVERTLQYGNSGRATDYGGEASLAWTPFSRWRFSGGYANLHMNGALSGAAIPAIPPITEDNAPRHTFEFRSFLNLTRRLEWDQWVTAQTHFPGGPNGSHTRVDTRVAWRAGERLEFSVVGQNLFHPGWVEFDKNYWIVSSRNERRILCKVVWTF
jgi:iron complex outermembrane receptor protein